MNMRSRIIITIVVLLMLSGGGFWWWNQHASAAGAHTLSGSGTIEAEDVLITSEVSGRVQSLLVDEGQEVAVAQTLAKLDPALLEAQRDQAAATVAVAEANLALLKAGNRVEDVAAAKAQADQARAARDGAAQGYENALKALKNPQQLDAQVIQAQAARDSAEPAGDPRPALGRQDDGRDAGAAVGFGAHTGPGALRPGQDQLGLCAGYRQ